MTDVKTALQTLASLDDKRKALVAKATELDAERKQIAFAAHSSNDSKARARLDTINLEYATFASEMNSLTEAITEANSRLAAAQAAEALAADREKAKQIAALNAKLKEELDDADDALADAINSVLSARALLMEMHTLGVTSPTDQMFRVNSVAVIKTAIQLLPQPWINDFEFARLAAIAQGNAAAQNEAMVAATVESGQRNMAVFEQSVIKDNTLMPDEWYGGQLHVAPPTDQGGAQKSYTIIITVDSDRHAIDVAQGPPGV